MNPLVGGKVTTKVGRTNLAHLSAIDEQPGHNAVFTVTRLRRDIGANSTGGLTLTTRDQATGAFNRLAAGDVRVVFGKLYYVAGQLGASWTRDTRSGDARTSPLWEAEFDRTGRSGFNYKLTGIGRDFSAQAGFVPRNDIITVRAFNRFSFYGARGATLEQLTVFFGPSRLWRYDRFPSDALEGSESGDLNLTFRGGWKASAHAEHNFTDFIPGTTPATRPGRRGRRTPRSTASATASRSPAA